MVKAVGGAAPPGSRRPSGLGSVVWAYHLAWGRRCGGIPGCERSKLNWFISKHFGSEICSKTAANAPRPSLDLAACSADKNLCALARTRRTSRMPVRKQNKSCDECRRSRIGCDAHLTAGPPCTNCKRRNKTCSTNWLTKREEVRGRSRRQETTAFAHDRPEQPPGVSSKSREVEAQVCRGDRATSLHDALWQIFTTLFEPQLGLWIGNDCNPFKRMTTAPKTLVSRLMVTLDGARHAARPNSVVSEMLRLPVSSFDAGDSEEDSEAHINQALMSAVHAFSARWLPVDLFQKAGRSDEAARRRLMQVLWEQAHQNMLSILTLPSYRSILALYLFAITPSGTSAPMSTVSQLCYETSLRHYLQLRLESRISIPRSSGTVDDYEELSHLEDSAYWFGLVCDVSRSLLRCQCPILLSGPSSQASVWALVSAQVDEFALENGSRPFSTHLLSDEAVLKILQLGSACKTMTWASIVDVQDSLFYSRTSVGAQVALDFALGKLQQFETVFLPHLERIARDFVLLSEKSQLGYGKNRLSDIEKSLTDSVWLVIHFHLGILILADSLSAASASLTHEDEITVFNRRLGSVRAIVNVVNLVRQFDSLNQQQSSLLLRDPYPEHASNALTRAAKSVINLSKGGSIGPAAASVLASALMEGLRLVCRISYSAEQSLNELTALFAAHGILLSSSQAQVGANPTNSPAIALDAALTPEMLESSTLRELGQQAAADPSLVEKTIERHELSVSGSTPDFGLDYLQFIDFTAVAGDWDFEDVFAGG